MDDIAQELRASLPRSSSLSHVPLYRLFAGRTPPGRLKPASAGSRRRGTRSAGPQRAESTMQTNTASSRREAIGQLAGALAIAKICRTRAAEQDPHIEWERSLPALSAV